jgi:hypothetical protein
VSPTVGPKRGEEKGLGPNSDDWKEILALYNTL